MTRLLTMKTAWLMDTVGNRHARTEIAAIKVAAPSIALKVIDRAIQVHGGGGVSDDFTLAWAYAHLRTLRLADGPDEVHKMSIARRELAPHIARESWTGRASGGHPPVGRGRAQCPRAAEPLPLDASLLPGTTPMFVLATFLYPCVLALLCAGAGLLVDRAAARSCRARWCPSPARRL